MDWWRLEIDDPVQAYLRAFATVRSLTNDEETELSRHVLANDEEPKSAGKTLVEANLAMVVSIAKRYPRGACISWTSFKKGNTALLAFKTFPDHPNLSFSAHAAACVNAAIARAVAAGPTQRMSH